MTQTPSDTRPTLVRRAMAVALPIVILLAGIAVGYWLLTSQPTAGSAKDTAENKPALVSITSVEATPRSFMIQAHGSVEAANATKLRPLVSGRITQLKQNLAPGMHFQSGETLVQLDASDYELALERAQTDRTNAKSKLASEKGRRDVAQRELKQVGASNVTDKERRLALRGPQLSQAQASLRSARSSVKQARINLDRAAVGAPFDGIVTDRSAAIGDVVSTGTTIATLAATERYWVDVSLPVEQLRWLHAADAEQSGSAARVYYPAAWGPDQYLRASVLRIGGSLERQSRRAKVLLQVPHPLGAAENDDQRLLLGAYVRVGIRVRPPADAVTVPAAYLRENDHVWIKTSDDKLAVRKVQVAYQNDSQAIVTHGLDADEAIVTTDLAAPIDGQPLRVKSTDTRSDGANSSPDEDDDPADAGDAGDKSASHTKQESLAETNGRSARLTVSADAPRHSGSSGSSQRRLRLAPATGLIDNRSSQQATSPTT